MDGGSLVIELEKRDPEWCRRG